MDASPAPTAVIVFAKAPVPGQVKTRLAPRLDARSAAALHATLVERTLATARAAAIGPIELCCAPDASHPAFADWARRFEVTLTEQGEGDLGTKMARALDRSIGTQGRAVLIGTDCPVLDAAYLRAAAARLTAGPTVVLGPAEDGGYMLVGAARPGVPMFDGIEWGSAHVLEETRRALERAGIVHAELPTLWDLDRPADYERYLAITSKER